VHNPLGDTQPSSFYCGEVRIAILFCGCISNSPVSNSISVTSPTITSQNPDDLYFQYIAEYENAYLNTITPYMSKKIQDSSDYANMKSTFTELRTLSIAYQEKIEPLNVSSKYELSKKYYLESLKQRQLYSEATLAGPYPNNPSNSDEVDSFNNYMISLRPYMNSAKIFFNNAMITEVCTNLFEKQNYSVSVCNSIEPTPVPTSEYCYSTARGLKRQPLNFVCTESSPTTVYRYDELVCIWCEY
jgi:hypothetical protein